MEMSGAQYTAGLVFLEQTPMDSMQLSSCFQRVLEQNGYKITAVNADSASQITVVTDEVTLTVGTRAAPDDQSEQRETQDVLADCRMIAAITMHAPATQSACSDQIKRDLQTSLAKLSHQLTEMTKPDYIQWLHPDTLLEREDFLQAASRILPRRVRKSTRALARRPKPFAPPLRSPAPVVSQTPVAPRRIRASEFPNIENISTNLACEYERRRRQRTASGQLAKMHELRGAIYTQVSEISRNKLSSARRLATWMLSISVALFFLPLGILLALVNLLRGEDLRLTGQTLALTGLLVTLNTTGATADVLRILAG